MWNTETEMEDAFFAYLINTDDYVLIKRQFCLHGGKQRLDILAVNRDYKLEIYELKLRACNADLGQIASYKDKFKPRKAVLVYRDAVRNLANIPQIGKWMFGDELRKEVDVPTQYDGTVPKYLIMRLNPHYLHLLDKSDTMWYGTVEWKVYAERKMTEFGFKTRQEMALWYQHTKYKHRKDMVEYDQKLDSWIGGKVDDQI